MPTLFLETAVLKPTVSGSNRMQLLTSFKTIILPTNSCNLGHLSNEIWYCPNWVIFRCNIFFLLTVVNLQPSIFSAKSSTRKWGWSRPKRRKTSSDFLQRSFTFWILLHKLMEALWCIRIYIFKVRIHTVYV